MDELSPYLERTVLVANRKGGVLKSSIVRSVADEAARSGYRVLAVDGDPQGNLSKVNFGLGDVDVDGWESDRGASLSQAMLYGQELKPISAHGVDVVCGGPELLTVLGGAIANPSLNVMGNLRRSLANLAHSGQYDLIVLDSGPGDTVLLEAYMQVAKWLVVPVVDGDENSLDGLDKIGARYVQLKKEGADLEVLGAVLTLVDHKAKVRNAKTRQILEEVMGGGGEPFDAMIRDQKSARGDLTRYGLSAAQVAEHAEEKKKGRLKVLREAKGGKHKAAPLSKLENPDEPWHTRDGSGLASDYRALTHEILARMTERIGAVSA